MADGGGEIIIRGGSCEIHFDESLFQKDTSDPSNHKLKHVEMRIEEIHINEDPGKQLFDGYYTPDGFKGEIKIKYWYPKKA